MPPGAPVVYYALDGTGECKIGFTRNLHQRMVQVRPASVAAVEAGSYQLERARHDQFASTRSAAEWFRVGPELEEHISALHGRGT